MAVLTIWVCAGTGRNTQKTVAIVLGGIVGFGLVIALLMFLRSTLKKQKSHSKHGGKYLKLNCCQNCAYDISIIMCLYTI